MRANTSEWTPPVSPVEHYAEPTPAPDAPLVDAVESPAHAEGESGSPGFAPHQRTKDAI